MLERLTLENFGRHKEFKWQQHCQINLLIGENDTGKTQLLKLAYSLVKSAELFNKRQQSTAEPWADILAKKLLWTFQPDGFDLGKLVTRGEGNKTRVDCRLDKENVFFSFGQTTTKQIKDCSPLEHNAEPSTALYIPPKEVLSALEAIYASRKQLEIPGFDDTYIDLIDSLRLPTTQGNISRNLLKALEHLKTATGGGELKQEKGEFVFSRGREKYGLRSVAEGIRKVSILSQLIRNRSITKNTILFIDEPETNLHPKAIVLLVEMLYLIAESGVQIYIATHSEFLLKRFEQLARGRQEQHFVQLVSLLRGESGELDYQCSDLADGLPDNPIIQQSITLFEEDARLDLA
jgi:AAA15 family ATPase/GTPase